MNDIILYIMLALMALAGIDYCFGNKFGLGDKYKEAFNAMGTLATYMIGALCAAPALAVPLTKIITPLYDLFGAEPAMFAGTILGNDTGAYPLAAVMANGNADAGNFSGLILGSMLGITVSFLIPYILTVASPQNRPHIAKGIMIGIITIPLGCFTGGALAGYDFLFMLRNLIPAIIFSGIIASGLIFTPKTAIKIFLIFGKLVGIFLTLTLIAAAIEGTTGFVIIKGMDPISKAFAIVGGIVIVLAGAFSLVYILNKILHKYLAKFALLLKVNEKSVEGLTAALANTIAMVSLIKYMDERGLILNSAFAVSAGFALGDHLGFTAGVNKEMILSVVAGKLAGGISALILALIILSKSKKEKRISAKQFQEE